MRRGDKDYGAPSWHFIRAPCFDFSKEQINKNYIDQFVLDMQKYGKTDGSKSIISGHTAKAQPGGYQ